MCVADFCALVHNFYEAVLMNVGTSGCEDSCIYALQYLMNGLFFFPRAEARKELPEQGNIAHCHNHMIEHAPLEPCNM